MTPPSTGIPLTSGTAASGPPRTGPPSEQDGGTAAGRHRGGRRGGRGRLPGRRTPARTGLLGASAAMAMGVVAMASGLFSGGDSVQLGGGPGGQVRADEAPAPRTRPEAPAPDRGQSHLSRRDERAPLPPAAPPAPSAHPAPAPPAGAVPAPSPPAPDVAPAQGGAPGAAPPQARGPAGPGAGTVAHLAPVADRASGEAPQHRAERPSAARQVLALVNEERARVGCRPLVATAQLSGLAQAFSDDMARRGFFSHTDPEGRTPWDRASVRGVRNLGGENIARGHPDAQAVMDAWMRSAGHRANILNCDYRTLGVGVSPGPNGPWWTQDFGY
ncbi:CAP domain-containing protein [Streptomyces gamaensis]|uniref:CAP domain-containing protein n=1 Tax=Streptomyces gamaensis TaxID=1763542 RepID=A0ABW0Z3J5_9ACTN